MNPAPEPRGAVVWLKGLRHSFELGDGRMIPALRLDELAIGVGERLALRGPNGSGKTTLLHIIAGLLRPTEGQVKIEGTDLYALSQGQRDRFRARRIGYLYQAFYLLDSLSALENVLCAASFAGALPRREQRERARALLVRFGLGERLDHRPSQLSAGQQQRVAAARALINDPPLVLCDEPTASLDEETARLLLEDLEHHCADRGATLLVASHDPEILAAFPVYDLKKAEESA